MARERGGDEYMLRLYKDWAGFWLSKIRPGEYPLLLCKSSWPLFSSCRQSSPFQIFSAMGSCQSVPVLAHPWSIPSSSAVRSSHDNDFLHMNPSDFGAQWDRGKHGMCMHGKIQDPRRGNSGCQVVLALHCTGCLRIL
jgi:hypothetical protein